MQRLLVTGGSTLEGSTRPSGSKNAALPMLVASLLCNEPCRLDNVPDIEDVRTMTAVLRALGVKVERLSPHSYLLDASTLSTVRAPFELVTRMRASFYVAGPLLARWHKAEVPVPGGCSLGPRPVDFHLQAFRSLGAEVEMSHGYMLATAPRLTGARIFLNPRYSSVGTTINTIMAACLADGVTEIEYAAREPEVVDTVHLLRSMGARISGEGTSLLRIEGVDSLHGYEWTTPPDRIETGTLLIAAAATEGDVLVTGARPEEVTPLLDVLADTGAEIQATDDAIHLRMNRRPAAVPDIIHTAPYPGFPTDLQPLLVALLSTAEGVSTVEEAIFTNRFGYVDELKRMGANIQVSNQTAIIRGVPSLSAAPVKAPDLRAGAALVIAALTAHGTTEITGLHHIDRGYERLEEKLNALGAHLQRLPAHDLVKESTN